MSPELPPGTDWSRARADATAHRSRPAPHTPAVIERLLKQGSAFSFFQAVWLLERLGGMGTPVGQEGPVASESIHFRPDTSFAFPAADVKRMASERTPEGKNLYKMDVAFFGLYGVATPMPLHYALEVLRQVEGPAGPAASTAGEPAGASPVEPVSAPSPVRDFLDVLNHRLISLFYRSWTKYRYHVKFGSPRSDDVTNYLLWLIGLQPGWSEASLGFSPLRLLRYAGAMTQRPHSATMLEGILQDYWKTIPVEVRQCVGRWVALSPASLNVLGRTNSRLGEDLILGEQIYDLSGMFDVAMGPLDWATYESFLPGTDSFLRTQQLTRLFSLDPLAFRIELKIKAAEIPETRLGCGADVGRLGFTSWIRTRQMPDTSVTFTPAIGASN